MADIFLVRHGETAWNRELRFQGQIDVPLNDLGLTQAQRLARRPKGCHQSQSLRAVIRPPTFDQRDSLRQGPPVAGLHRFCQFLHVHHGPPAG